MVFSRRDDSKPVTIEHPHIPHEPVVNAALLLALTFETVELGCATTSHDVQKSGKELRKEVFTTRIGVG